MAFSESTTISGLVLGGVMPCWFRGFRPCARAGRGLIARVGGVWPCVASEGGMGASSESLSEVPSLESESGEESDELDEEPESESLSISTSSPWSRSRSTLATGMFEGACPWLSNTPRPRFWKAER
ncbi:hypothetical protein GSI_10270 [Ganoderma sinense ZZ0214-1]|uniref:Uncharacterized protein n=1 Tax=Ganoderma sinense ZZ0214-1 TaxID=1077348 RepID=A0A2G8S028_9APHY|nr:hypothetical protein GSI_10270 [Ganoderma sinense ZZ0214-1]